MEEDDGRIWRMVSIVSALILGGGFYYYRTCLRSFSVEAPAPAAAPATPPEGQDAEAPPVALDQSDEYVRSKALGLSPSPRWARWLKADNLIRRAAAAVLLVAEGKSPRDSLKSLRPEGRFSVLKKGRELVIDPRGYARYDAVGDVFESLNAQAVAGLYRAMRPLFQQACRELDCPGGSFHDAWVSSMKELLGTPVTDADIQLKKKVVTYAMVDETLENLSPAQKHLLRMGPKNTAKVQAKLREVLKALGASEK